VTRLLLLVVVLALTACTVSRQSALPTASLQPTPTATEAMPTASAAHTANPVLPAEPVSTPTAEIAPTSTATAPSTFPDPQSASWRLIVDNLERPVAVVDAGDGSDRLFIVEQAGVIRIFQGGELLAQPFLDIRQRVGSRGNEQGLLGLAFHPAYAANGFFYVNYTNRNGDTVIARFSVTPDNVNRADAQSEKLLLKVDQPYANHNGGAVVFGPDGYLYLGLGDGGSGGDPQGNAQSLHTHLGKILRLDVDGGDPYAVPAGNMSGDALPEIWAYGLRNPWRFSFDRLNGDLYIADVGQNAWEEVNFLAAGSPAGANFGWDYREGFHPYEGQAPASRILIEPVVEYDHSQGCSVTGGYVYRGERLPAWNGVYLYGDYCSGLIWGLLRDQDGAWQTRILFETDANISSFGEDAHGELYLVDLQGGVYQLKPNP